MPKAERFTQTPNVEKPQNASAAEPFLKSLRSRARLAKFVALVELSALAKSREINPREVPVEKRHEASHEASEVAFRGFELLGYRESSMRRFFGAFPEAWSRPDAVGRVSYADEHLPMNPDYHIAGYEGGHCTLSPGREPSEIVITRDAVPEEDSRISERMFGVMSHELAHANDPMNASDAAPEQRAEFQVWLNRRVLSERRLRFPYVENIHHEQAERQQALRAQEYFAELVRVVMEMRADASFRQLRESWESYVARKLAEDGHSTPEQAHADVEFLMRYGHMFSPSFSWEDAQNRFHSAMRDLNRDRAAFQSEAMLNRIEDGFVQAAFRRAIFAEQSEMPDAYFLTALPIPDAQLTLDQRRLRRGLALVRARQDSRANAIHDRVPKTMRGAFDAWSKAIAAVKHFRNLRWANGSGGRNVSSDFQQRMEQAAHRIPSDATAEDRERFRQALVDFVVLELFGDLGLNAEEQRLVHDAREIWRRGNWR